jgi:hypothetical protein
MVLVLGVGEAALFAGTTSWTGTLATVACTVKIGQQVDQSPFDDSPAVFVVLRVDKPAFLSSGVEMRVEEGVESVCTVFGQDWERGVDRGSATKQGGNWVGGGGGAWVAENGEGRTPGPSLES